jgi:hypothetical protein
MSSKQPTRMVRLVVVTVVLGSWTEVCSAIIRRRPALLQLDWFQCGSQAGWGCSTTCRLVGTDLRISFQHLRERLLPDMPPSQGGGHINPRLTHKG